jgi:Gas vesicle synthesis protein GvpO
MPSREQAQKSRAASRARRRKTMDTAESAKPAESQEDQETTPDGEPPSGVKQAAKVAAVGAAVGAATVAARALAHHGDEDEQASEPQDQATPEAEQAADEETESQAEPEETQAEGQPAEGEETAWDREEEQEEEEQEPVAGADASEAAAAVRMAREQLSALLERDAESVSGLERTHDGWLVTLQVVELARIPDTTDVLASYEVALDSDLGLRRYGRVARYTRSQADVGDSG